MLILQAQSGDKQAFELLCERHYPLTLKFANSLTSDVELAKDCVQECWIKLAKNIRQLRDPRGFKSWLYKTLRWKILDQVRSLRFNAQQQTDDEQVDSFDAIGQSDASRDIAKLIAQLPEDEMQTVILFYLSDLDIVEISLVMEVPVGTVKSRLFRARKRLTDAAI